METAKSLARFVSNMNCFEVTSSDTQNILLSTSECLLKKGGYAANLFDASLVENDSCHFSVILVRFFV